MNFANETKFRQHVVAAIRKGGGFAQQIESPTLRGIPDVFYKNIAGSGWFLPGWIELKVIRPRDKNHVGVSGAQWLWAKNAKSAEVLVTVVYWDQVDRVIGIGEFPSDRSFDEVNDKHRYGRYAWTKKQFDNWLTTL